MVSDETPDIPLRSSDVYLAELLARTAGSTAREAAFTDDLVRRALASGAFREESRLIDRIAAAYNTRRPATLVELDQRASELLEFLDDLDARGKTWEGALGDFNQANLGAFLASRPAWRARLDERALRRLDGKALREVMLSLLAELAPSVEADPARLAEANRLVAALSTTDEISYRAEIRLAALLRMRFVFTSIAGRLWIKNHASEAKAVEALTHCEELALPVPPTLPRIAEQPESSKMAFPALAEDQRRAATAKPGWLGITFVPLGRGRRKDLGVADGAALITLVAPRSPAADAGLRPGDIVLGAPGRPFARNNELRPFVASANFGSTLTLEALRGENRVSVRATVGEAPATKRKN